VVGSDHEHAHKVALGLHAVGLWGVVGLATSAPERWLDHGLEVQRVESWNVATLAEKLGNEQIQLIDVREREEWESGHVRGSHSLPLRRLTDPNAIRPEQSDGPLVVVCAGGMRAAFAASVIRGWGHTEVIHVNGGGIGNLPAHGIRLVTDQKDTEADEDTETDRISQPADHAPA
jgi:rhodanese-related sulfurtransferase